MKIDSAIQEFVEKYDKTAMDSIDQVSKQFGLNINEYKIDLFNITEAFNNFGTYLQGYCQYKIENKGNEKASPQDAICEAASNFINSELIKESKTLYADIPEFVAGYVNGVKSLIETVDKVKKDMMEAEVEMEAVGDVNKFTDQFMEKIHELFDPAMDRILWASGYNANKKLFGEKAKQPKEKAVFL